LLDNHFHFLVRIPDLTTFKKLSNLNTDKACHEIVSNQFKKFFQSYAMAFNIQNNRIGTLFQTPFKRSLVDSDEYLSKLVYYIHANPQVHGLTDDFKEWKWSSYNRILKNKATRLKKQEVLEWFGSIEGYTEFHLANQKMISKNHFIFED
jgi:putative transposase